MHRATNLHWPSEPFGASQRPFAPDRPMLAAVALGRTDQTRRRGWACVVYLYIDNAHTLDLDGWQLNFGFELLTSDASDTPAVMARRLDQILVACRRHAKILAGHDLAGDLAWLMTRAVEHRLPGVEVVRRQWTTRHATERGMARMVDTAHDLGQPEPADLAGACAHTGLTAAALVDPHEVPLAVTIHQPIVTTVAVALIAARATGKYRWRVPVDLDQLVTDAVWDQLDDAPLTLAGP